MSSAAICIERLEVRRLLSVAAGGAPDSFLAAASVAAPLAVPATPPKPTEGGVTLSETAHDRFTARLGEVTVKVVDLALNAVIDWGDGFRSPGKMVGSYATGEYYIQGTHRYANAGTYKVNVGIYAHPVGSPVLPTDPIAGFTSVVNVKPLTPSQGGTTLTETATQKFTAKLGEVTVKVVDLALGAVVDWGDGQHSAGKLVGSYATGEYYVEGTHKYTYPGTYKVDVKIFAHPIGSPILPTGAIAQFTSVMKVKPLVPSSGGTTLGVIAKQPFTRNLGEVTVKVIDLALAAVVDWGDGTHSVAKLIGSYATGEYYVQGTHTYAQAGAYKVDVKIFAHPIGSPVLATDPIAEFTSVIKAKVQT